MTQHPTLKVKTNNVPELLEGLTLKLNSSGGEGLENPEKLEARFKKKKECMKLNDSQRTDLEWWKLVCTYASQGSEKEGRHR